MKTHLTALFLGLAPCTPFADEMSDLHVMHAVALESLKLAKTGAAYMIVHNMGDTDDTLLGVDADFPRVMIHDTAITDDGVARMFHVDAIAIPAGDRVIFAPGGKHIMFMGLEDQLVEGDTIDGTLIFEHAGNVAVSFNIVSRENLPDFAVQDHRDMDHSDIDHGTHNSN